MKNKLLSLLAATAVIVSLTACQSGEMGQDIQSSEAVSSTTISEAEQTTAETTAPDNAEVIYETLAEGQERDWKIEDVLKNDLEIDGIPISLPCTVEELLNTLGDEYSVDETYSICYNNERTSLSIINGEEITSDMVVRGFQFMRVYEKGILGFRNSSETYYEIISKYPNPNELEFEKGDPVVRYSDDTHYFNCWFSDDNLFILYIGEYENE